MVLITIVAGANLNQLINWGASHCTYTVMDVSCRKFEHGGSQQQGFNQHGDEG